MLFEYPPPTHFGKVLPKTKIYEYAKPTPAVRQRLIDEVEKIYWRHKLSPESLKLPPGNGVAEIQVLELHPKGEAISDEVLRCIDKAIPSPLIFEICLPAGWLVKAAFKEKTAAGARTLSEYFCSRRLPANARRHPLPVVLNLRGLYEQLLAPLLPHPLREGEPLQAGALRFEAIAQLQRQIKLLKNQLQREPQFNRKVGLNAELRQHNEQLAALLNPAVPQ